MGSINPMPNVDLLAAGFSTNQMPPWMETGEVVAPADLTFRNPWNGEAVENANPWLTKASAPHLDEEQAENALMGEVVNGISKAVAPKEAATESHIADAFAKAIASGDFHATLNAELQKSQFSELSSASLRKADAGWNEEIETSSKLIYKTRIGDDGETWSEGFDAAGVLQSARLVTGE